MSEVIIRKDSYIRYPKGNDLEIQNRDPFLIGIERHRKNDFNYFYNKLMSISAIAQAVKEFKEYEEGCGLRVVISKNYRESIKKKHNFLRRKNNGYIMPMIFDKNNQRYEKQIDLIDANLDTFNLLDKIIIQQQLAEVVIKLEQISETVNRILRGQENDRVSLAKSAKYQFLEALNVNDNDLKRMMLVNTIKSAHDARAQLIENLVEDINKFLTVPQAKIALFFKQCMNGNYQNEVYQLVHNVHKGYEYIFQTSYIITMAYVELGQPQNIVLSNEPFKEVLDYMLGQNNSLVEKLYLFDEEDVRLIWKSQPLQTLKRLSLYNCVKRKISHELISSVII